MVLALTYYVLNYTLQTLSSFLTGIITDQYLLVQNRVKFKIGLSSQNASGNVDLKVGQNIALNLVDSHS